MAKKELSTRAKTIIQGSIIGVVCIGLGITCGYLIKTYTTPVAIDYDNMNIAPYLPDETKIMEKYEQRKQTKSFNDLSAGELLNISFELYRRQKHSATYCIGNTVASIVTQGIRSCLIRNGKDYFEENLSKSTFVNVANRTYSYSDGYERYIGEATSSEEAKFDSKKMQFYTKEQLKDKFGKTLDEIFIYVVSDKTVKTGKIDSANNQYTIVAELDPTYSVYYYVRQMKNISNLKTYPTFSKVQLTVTTDSDLNISKMKVNESYYALTSAGIGSNLDSELTFTYYNKTMQIPELNTPINYKEAM